MKMGDYNYYNCENNLEIYGKWDDLKKFYTNNWGSNGLSFRKIGEEYDEPSIIECEKNLYNIKMDMIYYIFLTKSDPPLKWLDKISKIYNNLEFNLVYQNRENERIGDYIYKNGEVYYDKEEVL